MNRAFMLAGISAVALFAVVAVYLKVEQRFLYGYSESHYILSSNQGYVTGNGLYVEKQGERYLYGPKPADKDWVEVEQIPIDGQAYYPVYYTKEGYQVIRKNPFEFKSGFILHGWLNNTEAYFLFDTGASGTYTNNATLIDASNGDCLIGEVITPGGNVSTCTTRLNEVNFDGVTVEASNTESLFMIHPIAETDRMPPEEALSVMGMNFIRHLDFAMDEEYLYIRPRKGGLAKMSMGVYREIQASD